MNKAAVHTFREAASDPEAWRRKARILRRSAQSLWDSYVVLLGEHANIGSSREDLAAALDSWRERVYTAQLLYGLALEAAIKARIIEHDPASIQFKEIEDDEGVVVDLRITKIGIDLKDGHDLKKLANAAGLVGESAPSVFSTETDRTAINEILAYLSDCVRWSGRYPAPRKMSEGYVPAASIPSRILGHYMRDWLDPLLDALLGDESQTGHAT